MGNIVSFSSPELQGAVSYDGSDDYGFKTSYGFSPDNPNAFGIPATVSVNGADATEPITPTITVPAATEKGKSLTFTCNAFPPGVTESSLLCPGAENTAIGPGTVSINFVGGDTAVPGYYTGAYAFSVVTAGGDHSTGPGPTASGTHTVTVTRPVTTKTVAGNCATGSGRPSGTGSLSGTGLSSSRSAPRGSSSLARSSSGADNGTASQPSSGTVPISSGGSAGSSGGSAITGTPSSGSKLPTITNPSVSTTSTSTHVVTTTLTTVITTYVPCSEAVATSGSSTIYSSSLTQSLITKTVTSVKTEYTVVCPATENEAKPTKAAGAAQGQSPHTTIVLTRTEYVCPTPPPPPSCPTAAEKVKREAGYAGPDYTFSNGESGPTKTGSGSAGPTGGSTVTTTKYASTFTTTQGCSSTGSGPYASSSSEGGSRRMRNRIRNE